MSCDDVRVVDADSEVTVQTDDGPEAVRVKFGPSGITLVGSLADLHRIIVEADTLISRLVTRPTRRRPID